VVFEGWLINVASVYRDRRSELWGGGKAILDAFGGPRDSISRALVATSDWKYRKH
jgi:hypothetical protein